VNGILESIQEVCDRSSYDFREHACPTDDLAYLFPDWVAGYRLKHAIASVLQPRSILEIGVGHGYAARALLDGSPSARYIGVGSGDGLQWARTITAGFIASFIAADPLRLTALPGGTYDLVHLAGLDPDATFRCLELALRAGDWLLLDGFFRTGEIQQSANHFLKKYRAYLDFALVIPGNAGELLIRANERAASLNRSGEYRELADSYDASYFLQDCGGYDSFRKSNGRELGDPRLVAMQLLVMPQPGMRILDVGCGRGELAYAMARRGAQVVAVDYAADAVAIARQTYADTDELRSGRLTFTQADILEFQADEPFDAVVASDFVEHLEPPMLAAAVARLAGVLKPAGRFYVHTAPNLLNYRYVYARRRELARAAGCYLPVNPRSVYEDQMHINEQTPARLNRLLRRHFPGVVTWATALPEMTGTLATGAGREDLINATSIFAVATDGALSKSEVLGRVSQQPLDPAGITVRLAPLGELPPVIPGQHFRVPVAVTNEGLHMLASLPPNPVNLSYHWRDSTGGLAVHDGMRTTFTTPLLPGDSRRVEVDVVAPAEPGCYELQLTLVQEGKFWFEEQQPDLAATMSVRVEDSIPANRMES
jgi:2-polyprenyl-3-methyl-5-hydroxy-6-metoxy-1,4-benzoquinol methylase